MRGVDPRVWEQITQDSVADHIRNEQNRRHLEIISRVIQHKIRPFSPGKIRLQVTQDLEKIEVVVTSSTFEEPAKFRPPLCFDSDVMAEWVGNLAGSIFRSRMNLEPSPNHILGEQ